MGPKVEWIESNEIPALPLSSSTLSTEITSTPTTNTPVILPRERSTKIHSEPSVSNWTRLRYSFISIFIIYAGLQLSFQLIMATLNERYSGDISFSRARYLCHVQSQLSQNNIFKGLTFLPVLSLDRRSLKSWVRENYWMYSVVNSKVNKARSLISLVPIAFSSPFNSSLFACFIFWNYLCIFGRNHRRSILYKMYIVCILYT